MRLALLLLLAGCTWHAESPREAAAAQLRSMQDAVPEHVADPQRAARLHAAIGVLAAEINALEDSFLDLRGAVRGLNANPDAARADFDLLLDRLEARRK